VAAHCVGGVAVAAGSGDADLVGEFLDCLKTLAVAGGPDAAAAAAVRRSPESTSHIALPSGFDMSRTGLLSHWAFESGPVV
jgi:hypothetical protein